MNICILLNFVLGEWGMLVRPKIAEIYGEHFTAFGHKSTFVLSSNDERIQHNWHGEIQVVTVPRPRHGWWPIRLLQYIPSAYQKMKILLRLIDLGDCDLILVEDDLPGALIALWARRLKRVPVIFQNQSPNAEIMIEKSALALYPHPGLYRLLGKFQLTLTRFIMRKADLVLVVSDSLRQALISEGLDDKKIIVSPSGAAVRKFAPTVSGECVRREYGLIDCPVIVYAGSMDKLRRLDILLYAFAQVKDSVPGARLLLIGDGNDRENLKALAAELDMGDFVIFIDLVPYPEMPRYLAAGDIAVSPIPPKYIYEVSSPVKLFEYMAAGKPVVANYEIPEHRHVLEHSKGGVLVSFDSESFAAGLVRLLQAPETGQAMGRAGREWVVEHRSYKVLARDRERKYIEFMRHLRENGGVQSGQAARRTNNIL